MPAGLGVTCLSRRRQDRLRGALPWRPRAMHSDDCLAERDVMKCVASAGDRFATAGDALVEMDQLLFEAFIERRDLLGSRRAWRFQLAGLGDQQCRHAAKKWGRE